MRTRVVLAVACCVGTAGALRSSQNAQPDPEPLSQSEALGLVRVVLSELAKRTG